MYKRQAVTSAVNEANAHMLQPLTALNDQLVSLKAELSDRVHTENVKCFRNIQDLFKVMGDKVDTVSELSLIHIYPIYMSPRQAQALRQGF